MFADAVHVGKEWEEDTRSVSTYSTPVPAPCLCAVLTEPSCPLLEFVARARSRLLPADDQLPIQTSVKNDEKSIKMWFYPDAIRSILSLQYLVRRTSIVC